MTDIEKLKQFLIRCCYWYYVKADPLITDYEYDQYIKTLQQLEDISGVFDDDSPTQKIWGDCEDQYTEDWMKARGLYNE